MEQGVEDLSLHWVEKLELFFIQIFKLLVSKRFDRHWPQVEQLSAWEIFIRYIKLTKVDLFVVADVVPSVGKYS